jgi:hypothetical protein
MIGKYQGKAWTFTKSPAGMAFIGVGHAASRAPQIAIPNGPSASRP